MSETGSSPLDELRKEVITQKKAFLPPEPADPALAALHQAMQHYDQLVSEVVISVIQGLNAQFPVQPLQQARQQVELQLELPVVLSNRRAEFYSRYKDRLDHMLQLAQQAQNDSGV